MPVTANHVCPWSLVNYNAAIEYRDVDATERIEDEVEDTYVQSPNPDAQVEGEETDETVATPETQTVMQYRSRRTITRRREMHSVTDFSEVVGKKKTGDNISFMNGDGTILTGRSNDTYMCSAQDTGAVTPGGIWYESQIWEAYSGWANYRLNAPTPLGYDDSAPTGEES